MAANKIATQADVDLALYSDWIDANIVPFHGGDFIMKVGDVIIQDNTDTYINHEDYDSWLLHTYIGAASGNNINDVDYVITAAIDTDMPSEGVFEVANGATVDYYHYSSYTGSTFTLNTVDHPTGLVRTYGGSEAAYGARPRIGATWWFDGAAMGMDINTPSTFEWFNILDFNNESWLYMSTLLKPVILRPLRGQVCIHANGSNGVMFGCGLFEHTEINGECVAYAGYRDIQSPFMHGTFGFISWDKVDVGSHCYHLEYGTQVITEPSFKFVGLEAIGAFDGFRVALGGTTKFQILESVSMQRCYRHDANTGEGTYWGKTTGADNEKPRFRKIIVEDNVFARVAAETIQIQDMIDGASEKIIRNNVGMGGASDVLSPFQTGQGNTLQLVNGDGNTLVTKNIFGGSVDNGLIQFGTPHSLGNSGRVKHFDNLFLDARAWLFVHNSTVDTGLIFEWQRMTLIRESNRWKRNLWRTAAVDQISSNNGVSDWKFKGVKSDSTFPASLFGSIADFDVADSETGDDTFPDPEFVNAGLEYGELAGEKYDYFGHYSNTRYWGQYNGQHINSITDNGSGDIRLDINNAHLLLGGETVFLKGTANYDGEYLGKVVKIDADTFDLVGVSWIADELTQTQWALLSPPTFHNGEVLTLSNTTYGIKFIQCLTDNFEIPNEAYLPLDDVTNFAEIFWDVNGVRSDKAGYTGTPDPRTGGIFPPDDLRLVSGSYWGNRGYGVRWQDHSIDYEQYRWYIADDAIGTNKLIIPEAKEKVFNVNAKTFEWVASQSAKFIIGSVTPVNSDGTIGVEQFGVGLSIYRFTYNEIPSTPILSGGKTILASNDWNIYDSDGLEVEIPVDYNVDIVYLRALSTGTLENPVLIVGAIGGARPVVGNDSSANHIFANIGSPASSNFEAHFLEFNNTLTGGGASGISMGADTVPTNHKFSDIIITNVPFAGVFCNTNNTTKGYGRLEYHNMIMFQGRDVSGTSDGGEGFYLNTTGNKTALNLPIEYLHISNCWVEGFGREGVQLTTCTFFLIESSTFYNCGASNVAGQNRSVQPHNSQGTFRNCIFQGAQGGSIELFAEGVIFRNCYFSWDTDTSNGLWTLDNYGAAAITGGAVQFIDCIFDPSVPQSAATFEVHQDQCDIILTNCKQGANAHDDLVFDTRIDKVTFDIIETGTSSYNGGVPTYALTGEANKYEETLGKLTNSNLHVLGMGYRTPVSKQMLWDEIVELTPWVLSPIPNSDGDGGAYLEPTSHVTLAVAGDEIQSFKAMGNNIPQLSSSGGNANLQKTTYWSPSTYGNTWYQYQGEHPLLRDLGDFDIFMEVHNGTRIVYETHPLALDTAIGAPYHEIIVWRNLPCVGNETNHTWKHQGGNVLRVIPANPDVDSISNINWFANEVWEYKIDGAGNWEIWKNGVVDASGAGGSLTAYTEFKIGANGHPMEFHFRATLIDHLGVWTTVDLAIIRGNLDTIWGTGSLPTFPHFTNIEELDSSQQNAGTWDIRRNESEGDNIKVAGFGGGTGVEGATKYQWYYWDAAIDGIAGTPQDNKLDYHHAFIGADGQKSVLTRSDYETGNGSGNAVVFNNGGSAPYVYVMCVITPVDSNGVEGLPIVSDWTFDNIA